ncbi:SoxR reducing system RseC family protein [Halospina sp. K52047b]|nr:SoxR reducing system RseC family protein [Halospina sp. K52047b]
MSLFTYSDGREMIRISEWGRAMEEQAQPDDERQGEVLECVGQRARIRVAPAAGCSRCAAGEGCGQGLLGAMRSAPSPGEFWVTVPGDERVTPGDRVLLRMRPSALVAGAAMVYMVPLLGLVLGALLAEVLIGSSDGVTTAAGIAGLAGGLLLARYRLRSAREAGRYEPVFVRRVPDCDVQFT